MHGVTLEYVWCKLKELTAIVQSLGGGGSEEGASIADWNAEEEYSAGDYVFLPNTYYPDKAGTLWKAVNDNTNSQPSAQSTDWALATSNQFLNTLEFTGSDNLPGTDGGDIVLGYDEVNITDGVWIVSGHVVIERSGDTTPAFITAYLKKGILDIGEVTTQQFSITTNPSADSRHVITFSLTVNSTDFPNIVRFFIRVTWSEDLGASFRGVEGRITAVRIADIAQFQPE